MGVSASKSVAFSPERDIPSLKDKVILVTGGTSGLGKQSILELAKHGPKTIWLGARNTTKAQATINEIQAQVPGASIKSIEMELSSLSSVRASAQKVIDSSERLDILLLNAGVMSVPPGTTKEGYEIQFGTNHVGHAMLTKLLLPLLLKTADEHGSARVTVLSSTVHTMAPSDGIDFGTLKTSAVQMSGLARYGQSKLANALFAKELARRYPQLTVASVHPGVVKTNLSTTMRENSWLGGLAFGLLVFFLGVNIPTGTLNQLWASVSKDVVSGTYYEPVGLTGKGSALTEDETLAKKLWGWTEKELRAHGAK
ncbi:hypothetical protein Micbo1qcDRAFT_187349 [Microdochium bolleyi]|uniref:Uncharacterized protein n=1 Tax=Microdochium bolleyi TaxID=196109 RepID=A0A136JD34_9PEZI|nr:hypothetical protein Micbo1qcDRAFT_187349 [Microdochium bolleyi]